MCGNAVSPWQPFVFCLERNADMFDSDLRIVNCMSRLELCSGDLEI